ncbi:uncharacterized protein [Argopecten irradians]|uniref:uncharacterized protein n=1 Tax=Argopecten irradians TaxID=31199 RepID=UPI00371EF414
MDDSIMLEVLIEEGLILNKDTFDLAKAVLNGDENKVAKLLKRDADLSQIPDDCIQELVENREIRILKDLKDGGLKLKQMDMIDLYEAVLDRDIGKVRHLLRRGADPNQMNH